MVARMTHQHNITMSIFFVLKVYILTIILTFAVVSNVIILAAACVSSCGTSANSSILTWH